MSAFYRELTYRTAGYEEHLRAWRRADDLPGVSVLSQHARKLGFLERQALFGDEHGCRLVLQVSSRRTGPAPPSSATTADPYRGFHELITLLRHDVGDLIESLGAAHSEVTEGFFAFKTRDYEKAARDALMAELAEAASGRGVQVVTQVEGTPDEGDHVALFGRVRGDIPGVKVVANVVRRSGLVDPDDVRVQYA